MNAFNINIYLSKAILFVMLLPALTFAQKVIEYKNIKVGDTAPDILFKNLTKYKTNEQRLSDFSEKLLIIDFWATWCAPCVGMLPRMDSLQKEFQDDLIFISITDQPRLYAEPFLEKLEKNNGIKFNIPVIYGDTTVRKLFPHRLIPHYIWLDVKTRKVVSISDPQYLSRENIAHFFNNRALSQIPEKNDRRLDYDKSKPLLSYLTGTNEEQSKYSPKQYSGFWNYISELSPGISAHLWDSINNNRITVRNMSKQQLIQYAFGEGRKFFQTNSILLETKDKENLYTDLSDEPFYNWIEKNAITYEINVRPENRDMIFEMMRTDLINYFVDYDIRIEKRKTNGLVLISTGSNEAARSKNAKPEVLKDQFGYYAKNISLATFFQNLSFYYLTDSPVLINETAINFNIDIDLDVLNFMDLSQLNKELGKYNLKFIKKEALGEFLVIGDRHK